MKPAKVPVSGLLGAAWIFILLAACAREETPAVSFSPKPPPPATVAQASPAQASPPQALPEAKSSPLYTYDPKGRRDPFQPLIVASPSKEKGGLNVSELKLVGVILKGRVYYALLEAPNGLGYIVQIGDVVGDGAKVVRITKDSVAFEVKEHQQQARVVEHKLKKEE